MRLGVDVLRAVRVAGMVGLVLLGMVMGGVGYGAINSLYSPFVKGSLAFVSGNRYLDSSSAFRTGYVTGIHDAFRAIDSESSFLAEKVGGQAVDELRNVMGIDTKDWDIGALIAIFKVSAVTSKIPHQARNDQLTDLATEYIESHPTERHNSAALLVWRALADAEWK